MSNKKEATSHAHAHTADVATVLGGLTDAAIDKQNERTIRRTLVRANKLASGIARAYVGDLIETPGVQAGLKAASIDVDEAQSLAADGTALMALVADRDAKKGALAAAKIALNDARKKLDARVTNDQSSIRGKLGFKSANLTEFGIAQLGVGKRKRTSKKTPAAGSSAPPSGTAKTG